MPVQFMTQLCETLLNLKHTMIYVKLINTEHSPATNTKIVYFFVGLTLSGCFVHIFRSYHCMEKMEDITDPQNKAKIP